MKCFITGITGFCGSHLAELLLSQGHEIIGTKRHRSDTKNIDHILNKIQLIDNIDLCDVTSLLPILSKYKPDYIFHLAAQSYVHQSWEAYSATIGANIIGTYNLLNVVRLSGYEKFPRVLLAGSSEEYGRSEEAEQLNENSPCMPVSPYGVSKLAMTMAGVQMFYSYGIPIVMSRAFNHTGPRRGSSFLISNFIKQIVEMENGTRELILKHGDISTARDYTDVRDICKAYVMAIQNCEAGKIYNISSGKCYSGIEILDILKLNSKVNFETQIDNDRLRPSDISILHSCSLKFQMRTHWEAEIPIEKTIQDMYEYWRNELRR